MRTSKRILFLFVLFTILSTVFLSCIDKDKISSVEYLPDELKNVEYREMVDIPSGKYIRNIGRSVSECAVDDFFMGQYEVTQGLWTTVYNWAIVNGYAFSCDDRSYEEYDSITRASNEIKEDEPVSSINWRDSVAWCNAYSELMRYDPVYKIGGDILRSSRDKNDLGGEFDDTSVTMELSANGYRLPTELEWEFSASYDSGGDHISGDHLSGSNDSYHNTPECERVSWYKNNSDGSIKPVGEKDENYLGLYDMSGNVWEWCWDWESDYPSDNFDNYTGPSTGSKRIKRGGSFENDADHLTISYRSSYLPVYKYKALGFRVARRP